jgi:DNA adenine methylase
MSNPLGGILSYFGAKREMAPQIVSHFGPHTQYFEPFAGSLSVLFAKEECRHEVVSEKNPDVANLIRCISNQQIAEFLWRQADSALVSEAMFAEAAGRLSESMGSYTLRTGGNPMRAFDFLLVSWQGPSGLAGTTRKPRFAVRNTTSGGTVAARWRAVAESIPWWHERLKNVEFRFRDAFELIDVCPDQEGTVIYADPPYFSETRTAGAYAFDFSDEEQVRLADCLGRFKKTKVVLSLYQCEKADSLYSGWKVVKLDAPRKLKHTAGGEQQTVAAPEVLYVNRD